MGGVDLRNAKLLSFLGGGRGVVSCHINDLHMKVYRTIRLVYLNQN